MKSSEWFSIKKIAKNIYLIKEKHYKESANMYLIKGTKSDLLVDTGTGIFDIELAIADISQNPIAVNTHAHFDHAGGDSSFKLVRIHESEKDFVKNPDSDKLALHTLKPGDFSEDVPKNLITNYKIKSPKCVSALKDDDIIDLGNFTFKVIHTPGHTPGSICLYEKTKRILFTGDTLYNGNILCNLPFSDAKLLEKSIQKISVLAVKIVLPGHNEILNPIAFMEICKNPTILHLSA